MPQARCTDPGGPDEKIRMDAMLAKKCARPECTALLRKMALRYRKSAAGALKAAAPRIGAGQRPRKSPYGTPLATR